jgi:ribosomal small subunit protein bTHX
LIFYIRPNKKTFLIMGRGDKRTAKGKRFKKSFGNSRPKRVKKAAAKKPAAGKKAKAPKAVTAKKAPAKKAAAKKKAE